MRLLGTSLWSDRGLTNEPALSGGWFAAPRPDRWQAFAQKYQQAYGAQPDIRAGVVYDAVTLAVARQVGAGRRFQPGAPHRSLGFCRRDRRVPPERRRHDGTRPRAVIGHWRSAPAY